MTESDVWIPAFAGMTSPAWDPAFAGWRVQL